jgi:hypothetical protein
LPVRILTISTATGTFPSTNGISFGGPYRFASYADDATTVDKEVKGTVQGSLGGSPKWTTVLTLTTNSSGTRFTSTGSDLVAFDKLRVVLTANGSTEDVIAWLGASD